MNLFETDKSVAEKCTVLLQLNCTVFKKIYVNDSN